MHNFHEFLLSVYHGLVHWSGSDYGEPYGHFEPYDLISGLAGLSIVSGVIVAYRKIFCANRHCWRMGKHDFKDPKDGVTRKLCWRHHPDVVLKDLNKHSIKRIHNRMLAERKESS